MPEQDDTPSVFFKEYRACGIDRLATEPDRGQWHTDRSQAVRDLGNMQASYPPYRRAWLECRHVTAPVELVVQTDDTVTPSPALEAFLASLERGRAA